MNQNQKDIDMGRFLSLVLRHNPEAAYVKLDENGWADVNALIRGVNRTGRHLTLETLERIVRENSKNRYSFHEDHTKIRANQGHSIPVDLELIPVVPPSVLYHGTAKCSLDKIRKQGITSQLRQYVHLSEDRNTASQVGARHGKPVILEIDAEGMQQAGNAFYLSENHVWLCQSVPVEFIQNITKNHRTFGD